MTGVSFFLRDRERVAEKLGLGLELEPGPGLWFFFWLLFLLPLRSRRTRLDLHPVERGVGWVN